MTYVAETDLTQNTKSTAINYNFCKMTILNSKDKNLAVYSPSEKKKNMDTAIL